MRAKEKEDGMQIWEEEEVKLNQNAELDKTGNLISDVRSGIVSGFCTCLKWGVVMKSLFLFLKKLEEFCAMSIH